MEISYRIITKSDADAFWNLMNALDYETQYMLYEPGERSKNMQRVYTLIEGVEHGENYLLLALDGEEIVGYILAVRGNLNRIKHSAYIVVGIKNSCCNRGIGKELFGRLDQWARESRLIRLELTVMCHNERAKHLYEKCGFTVEGVKAKSIQIDGVAIDEYYMAKLLG